MDLTEDEEGIPSSAAKYVARLATPPSAVGITQTFRILLSWKLTKALQSTTTPTNNKWILNSGASSHLSNDINQLINITLYEGSYQIKVGNGHSLPITNTGQDLLPTPTRNLYLPKILHLPKLSHNLISVNKLTSDNNCLVIFDSHGYLIKDKMNHQILLRGHGSDDLYLILSSHKPTSGPSCLTASANASQVWHKRLGHPSSSFTSSATDSNLKDHLHFSFL